MNKLAEIFHKTLIEAQELRPQKSKWVGEELEWVLYERQVMLDAVNAARFNLGLPPLTNVDKAERGAMGHCDYTWKFALYCAELVTNDNPTY